MPPIQKVEAHGTTRDPLIITFSWQWYAFISHMQYFQDDWKAAWDMSAQSWLQFPYSLKWCQIWFQIMSLSLQKKDTTLHLDLRLDMNLFKSFTLSLHQTKAGYFHVYCVPTQARLTSWERKHRFRSPGIFFCRQKCQKRNLWSTAIIQLVLVP